MKDNRQGKTGEISFMSVELCMIWR